MDRIDRTDQVGWAGELYRHPHARAKLLRFARASWSRRVAAIGFVACGPHNEV